MGTIISGQTWLASNVKKNSKEIFFLLLKKVEISIHKRHCSHHGGQNWNTLYARPFNGRKVGVDLSNYGQVGQERQGFSALLVKFLTYC